MPWCSPKKTKKTQISQGTAQKKKKKKKKKRKANYIIISTNTRVLIQSKLWGSQVSCSPLYIYLGHLPRLPKYPLFKQNIAGKDLLCHRQSFLQLLSQKMPEDINHSSDFPHNHIRDKNDYQNSQSRPTSGITERNPTIYPKSSSQSQRKECQPEAQVTGPSTNQVAQVSHNFSRVTFLSCKTRERHIRLASRFLVF